MLPEFCFCYQTTINVCCISMENIKSSSVCIYVREVLFSGIVTRLLIVWCILYSANHSPPWPQAQSEFCTRTWKPGIIHLSIVPDTIKIVQLPTQVSYNVELQCGGAPNEDNEHADEFLCDNSWKFMHKFFRFRPSWKMGAFICLLSVDWTVPFTNK